MKHPAAKTESSKRLTRRHFLKQSALAGAAVFATASVGPWFIKDAFSTSGDLRLFTWSDYSKPEVIEAFEKATGINVKLTNYSTNVASFVGENHRLKGRVQKAAGPLAEVKPPPASSTARTRNIWGRAMPPTCLSAPRPLRWPMATATATATEKIALPAGWKTTISKGRTPTSFFAPPATRF